MTASNLLPSTHVSRKASRRWNPLAAALAAILASLSCPQQAEAALNDNLIDAQLVDLNGRLSFDTTSFTRETGEIGSGTVNARTAWFVWTAPLGGPASVRFATHGSSYDTIINLYKRDPLNPTPLVADLLAVSGAPENPLLVDDDAAITVTQGYVTWTPQAGTSYFISVGRNGGGGGATTLEATFGPVLAADAVTASIPNDTLAGALEIVATVTTPATQVPRSQAVPGTTISATAEAGEQTLGAASAPKGGTVWYRYRVGASAEVFSVALSDFDADAVGQVILQAFTNTVTPAAPTFAQLSFAEEDTTSSRQGQPRLVINAAANSEHYFRVTSTDGDGVLFNLRLDYNPTAPTNDLIASAVALASTLPSIRNLGENIYAATQSDPTGFNGGTSGANVWYAWRAPASGLVKIRSLAPTSVATTGNFHPLGSTFKYDCEVWFDTSAPKDTAFDTATAQSAGGFNDGGAQERTFYALANVVYFIEIGGDSNTNAAGRGYFGFVIEDTRLSDVARTGVSYGSEGVLKLLSPPVVNRHGDVAFAATLEAGGPVTMRNDAGLFLFNGATTRVSVVKGDQEYGTPLDIDGDGIKDDKVSFGGFTNLSLADRTTAGDTDADLGFRALIVGTSDDQPVTLLNNLGFYHDDPTNAGVRELRTSDYLSTSFTWSDGTAFLGAVNTPVREAADNTALVTGRMVGIPLVRDTGIFASSRNVVVQEEDPAPNTSEGVEFGDLTGTPTVNSADGLAFRAILRGPGVTAANDTAIYSVTDYNAAPTALNYRLRLRKGLALPGAAGSTLAGGAIVFSLGEPRLNSKGRIAVLAGLKPGSGAPAVTAANDNALVSDLLLPDLSFAIVAREGDFARDADGQIIAGVKFASFIAPALITSNAVIFTAKIAGTGVSTSNDCGIWLWDGTTNYLIARKGDLAPGVVGTSVKFKTLGLPLANPGGRVAFTAVLVGTGVTLANDTGLWAVEEDGLTPQLRLRKGDVYDFGRPELPVRRTVSSITVSTGSGGDDGFVRAMDQDGNIAVLVGLMKGTAASGQAIFKVTP